MLTDAASSLASTFDFDRVSRATGALIHVRRRQSLTLLLWIGALVALSLGSMLASRALNMWVVAALAQFVALPLLLLLFKDAWQERRARALAMSDDAALASRGFEAHVRRSLNLFALNQLGVLALLAWLALFAYRACYAGSGLTALASLTLLAVLAAWQWRRTLSPGARRREESFLRGNLSLDQYLRERSLWRFLRQRPGDRPGNTPGA